MRKILISAMIMTSALMAMPKAHAEDYVITIQNNQFSPAELTVPANQKFKIKVRNQNGVAAEFESHDLKREKVIAPNNEGTISVGPLKPGTYNFFDDFNPGIKGVLTAQ